MVAIKQPQPAPPIPNTSEFPADLVGKKILLATESLGPVNGVSRTTQSLVDYLRSQGAHVATCAPTYKGQPLNHSYEPKPERTPIVNKDWLRSIEAKSASLGSRAIGGAWLWHFDRDDQAQQQPLLQAQKPPFLNSKSDDAKRNRFETARLNRINPEFRLKGWPLPYNPDLSVAYPFRLGRVYDMSFKPDIIYLASPASVGFQFLVQLWLLDNPIPTLLNFQTDLAAYSGILFPQPIDQYAVWLLSVVQGFLFRVPAVHTIFYPSAYVRKYMVDAGAPDDRMIQLGRGVDTEQFNPGRRDEAYRKEIAPNGETIFCTVSRIAPEKGFEFLAKVAEKMSDAGLKFKLLIVGGNKNPNVENEVRGYFKNVQDKVIFTGMLRGLDLARAFAVADVFFHCSVTETFGLTVLESMASGVPVIARDEGGPSETVKHGKTGYLVAADELDTFVEYALQLATDESLRRQMIVDCRQQALETTWDKINNKVALQLAAALRTQPYKTPEEREREGYYSTWANMAKVYLAVGIVWIFWFIAVIPLLICGFAFDLTK